MTPKILVVDDDDAVRFTLLCVLRDAGFLVEEAVDGEAAWQQLHANPSAFHVVVTDLRMPRLHGLALLERTLTLATPPRVIMITAHGEERTAVQAMKAGAWHYLRKPFDIDEVVAVVQQAARMTQLLHENAQLQHEQLLARNLIFESSAMRQLAHFVGRIAPRDINILITGESGTGKERVAEAIVSASPRANKPFVRFNCASLTTDLAEAELFGHAKGAFTGAHRERLGLFREADGGTILLDEIGELAPIVQARLLRVLQSGEVRPVGEDRAIKVNLRILAATHRNLEEMVRDGTFREDLWYRLKVVHLHVPALRDRPADITPLARHFIHRAAERFQLGQVQITHEILAWCQAQPWPGNVRELEHAMEMVVALSEGRLDLDVLRQTHQESRPVGPTLKERVDAFERQLIERALMQASGNKSAAAQALGIGRVTLYDKMARYNITK